MIQIELLHKKVSTGLNGALGRQIFVGDVGYNDMYLHEIVLINGKPKAVRFRKRALTEDDVKRYQIIDNSFWHAGAVKEPKSITFK